MARTNNYLIQAQQAKIRFLTYDQEKLIHKFNLKHDEQYLYINLLGDLYRICRKTGDLCRFCEDQWLDANTFEELLTLLDLLCDSRDDRWLSGRWQNIQPSAFSSTRIYWRNGVMRWRKASTKTQKYCAGQRK